MGKETVVRIKREDGFTVLPNGLLRDDRLSLKTKGLFCMMLSFPGDWTYSISGLVTVCGAGRDAIRGALRELETAGYLDRERVHSEDGRFSGMVYTLHMISSIPQTENPTQQNKDYINTLYSPPEGDAHAAAQKCSKQEPDWNLFEQFWAAYPRKQNKERAKRAWKKLNPDLDLCQIMADALEKDKRSRD